jgi:4'-phosphopantetheinyl transferase superfamily
MLYEFYLRWSMKEAYTKAFGMGMNYNFASFEAVHLYPLDAYHPYVKGSTSSSDASSNYNVDEPFIQYDSTIDIGSGSLYEWICTKMSSSSSSSSSLQPQLKLPLCTIGTVTQLTTSPLSADGSNSSSSPTLQRPPNEQYLFYFYPFYNYVHDTMATKTTLDTGTNGICNSSNTNPAVMIGCACVCFGPINLCRRSIVLDNNAQETLQVPKPPRVHINWTNLQELYTYHSGNCSTTI